MNKGKIVVVLLILVLCLSACYPNSTEKLYYARKTNYITEEATVDNIIYDEEGEDIVFWLSEIDDAYQGSTFIIEGDSLSIVLEREVTEKIKIGDKITYTSATGYFGDAYMMPIVALSVDGEEILEFEEGYNNLLKWLFR